MEDLREIDINHLEKYKNVIVFILIVVGGLFFAYSAHESYSSDLERIKEKSLVLEEAAKSISHWRRLDGEFNLLKRSFFDEDPLSFKKYVEEEARNAGVSISSLRMSRQGNDFYHIGGIELDLFSSYGQLVNFIAELEKANVFANSVSIRELRGNAIQVSLNVETLLVSQ